MRSPTRLVLLALLLGEVACHRRHHLDALHQQLYQARLDDEAHRHYPRASILADPPLPGTATDDYQHALAGNRIRGEVLSAMHSALRERPRTPPPSALLELGRTPAARDAASRVRRGASRGDTTFPVELQGPRAMQLFDTAGVAISAALAQAADDDPYQAGLTLLAVAEMGQDCGRGGAGLPRLVGGAAQTLASGWLLQVLADERLAPNDRRDLVARLGRLRHAVVPLGETFRVEAIYWDRAILDGEADDESDAFRTYGFWSRKAVKQEIQLTGDYVAALTLAARPGY